MAMCKYRESACGTISHRERVRHVEPYLGVLKLCSQPELLHIQHKHVNDLSYFWWCMSRKQVPTTIFRLRAPEIALANRRDFLSQMSPSPARPQWGRLKMFLKIPQKVSQMLAIFLRKEKSQSFSGGEGQFGGLKFAAIFSPASEDLNSNRRKIATHGALSIPLRGMRCQRMTGWATQVGQGLTLRRTNFNGSVLGCPIWTHPHGH